MGSFSGAWSTADDDPTLTVPCDDEFGCSSTFRNPTVEPQHSDADWNGFFEQFQGEVLNQGHVMSLSDLPVSQEATCGAVDALDLSATSSWSSSSGASTTITPPDSATQPGLDWNASVSECQQSMCAPSSWNPDSDYGQTRFGSLSHDGLGIFLQTGPQQATPFGECYQAHNSEVNHYPPPPPQEPHYTFRAGPLQQYPCRNITTDDEEDEGDATDPCYAKLLWTCLKQAPGHTLSLKSLYEWVAQNSSKAKDPKTRGWQNSVRHNLSMNAAFERVPSSIAQGAKKGSLWRLTEKALREGVISTTRYRKDPKRKSERRGHPALKRQISGSKGGQATRAASRRQRDLAHVRSMPYLSLHDAPLRHPHPAYFDPLMSPYSPHSTGHSPQLLMTPTSPASPYFTGPEQEDMLPPLPPYMTKQPQAPHMYGEAATPALGPFECQQFNPNDAYLFRNYDSVPPDTPSLATEASFMTDDCMPGLMSRDLSRETTIF